MTDITPPPPQPSGAPMGGPDYPIHLEYDRDYEVQNWRPLASSVPSGAITSASSMSGNPRTPKYALWTKPFAPYPCSTTSKG